MYKTVYTTAGFIRRLANNKNVCDQWKDKIKSELFPGVFKQTPRKERKVIHLGQELTFRDDSFAASGGIAIIGKNLAPDSLRSACLMLHDDVEIVVDKRTISFYKKQEVLRYDVPDNMTVSVGVDTLRTGYSSANSTLKEILMDEFGKEACIDESTYNFGESTNVTVQTTTEDGEDLPLFIVKNWAKKDSDRLKLIAFNEKYFDVTETTDERGNRAFAFKKKIKQ